MAFRFSLEPLLRLRRSEHRQQELILQRAHEQVNGLVFEIEKLNDEMRLIRSGDQTATSAAELRFDEERCQVLGQRRVSATVRLQAARERQSLAIAEFQRAWRDREALETLRESEHQAYTLEENRREQRAQDDLFLQRQRRRPILPGALGKRCPSS